MLISDLLGQNVALLGAGRETRALAQRIRAQAPEQVLHWYSEAPVPEFTPGACDELLVGDLAAAPLGQHDILVRSPGISPYREALQRALEQGAEITSGSNLWLAENPSARTLCVTGTKGKSTTSALLAHLLRASGQRVGLAGNIGVPLLACDAASADWWVLELSSYQLCDLRESVWLGLITNLSDEHLDWHGGAERYRRDKLRLAELTPRGRLLANAADADLRQRLAHRPDTHWFNGAEGVHVANGQLWLDDVAVPECAALPGAHNRENLAAALAALQLIHELPPDLPGALAAFQGLPHRLQMVGEYAGRRYYDDSLSTTPIATLAALEALAGQPITVLVGGLDRGLDWQALACDFASHAPHALIAMPDSGQRLLQDLVAGGLNPPGGMHLAQDLEQAVALAREATPAGGVVLLSPGAPSFPHFRDFQHRGERFADLAAEQG